MVAAKSLGWDEIEVRFATELSEKEKRMLELEENRRRKDLTQIELSKIDVQRAELRKEIKRESQPLPPGGNKRRDDVDPLSMNQIASDIGMPQSTLSLSYQHVEAVEKYPDLAEKGKKEAIRIAKQRDSQGKEGSDTPPQPRTSVLLCLV
jgi:ParB-like chromosome segregation protein Spo0J